MDKIRTTNYKPRPGVTYGEWCWNTGITPEWKDWIADANDDWVDNEIRRIESNTENRMMTDEEDVLFIALLHNRATRS